MNRRVFFSFLGTTPYTPVHYALRDERSPKPEEFVQAVILDHLAREDGELVVRIGVTQEVREKKRWDALKARLEHLGERVQPVEVELRDVSGGDEGPGHDEQRLWALFDRLGHEFSSGDEVYFDITHGFRSLPVMALLALTFFSRMRGFTLGGIFYGAFESLLNRTLPSPDDVNFRVVKDLDLWCRDGVEKGPFLRAPETPAPIFDLTAMYALTAWVDGVSEWKRTGRADGLVERARPITRALRSQLRAGAPQDLVSFPDELKGLSDSLTSVRHDRFATTANSVVARLEGMAAAVNDHPSLTPLRTLAETLRADLAPLRVPFPSRRDDWAGRQVYSDAYLTHQCAVARWLRDRRRVVEAFTVLREAITSCAVRIAQAAGVTELAGASSDSTGFRLTLDGWAQVQTGANGTKCRPDAREFQPACDTFCKYLVANNALADCFRGAIEKVRTPRNRFDHAWTGAEHSSTKSVRSDVEVALQDFDVAASAVEALVRMVITAGPEVASVRRDPVLINLSNHPIATWSPEQLDAARVLDLGEPADLEGGMPLVPAGADEAAVKQLAEAIAVRAVAQGARGAHVATEFTLTMALVRALQARGVRCFAASTERTSREVEREGKTVKESAFSFVRWREYS